MRGTAALYLRSSKDRKDVSPDAQRRALLELAASRGETVVEEFVDAVESGKDADRPAFQRLIAAVRSPDRGWLTVLMYDTSRLSRRRVISLMFEELDCKANGVSVVYKTMPDVDPLTEIVLKSVLVAWDEYHSVSSRQKGLAGMGENVRAGFRAGGKAPRGYQLKKIATGAIREGQAVTKSVLEPHPDQAEPVATYMRARAAGTPRLQARRAAGLDDVAATTLIGMEWNALTYAGHTVWNVHAERAGGAYVGGNKRRPRAEWLIQRETQPAFISDADADRILAPLEARDRARKSEGKAQRARESSALLGGLLYAPDGSKWWSEDDRYRWKGKGAGASRSLARALIDAPVIDQVMGDLSSPEFAARLRDVTAASLRSEVSGSELRRLRTEMAEISGRISKTMDLATQLEDPAPALRRVEELERDRKTMQRNLAAMELDHANAMAVAKVTVEDVQRALRSIADDAQDNGRDGLRPLVVGMVERVELDPVTLEASLHYRIAAPESGVKVASPRGFEPRCPP